MLILIFVCVIAFSAYFFLGKNINSVKEQKDTVGIQLSDESYFDSFDIKEKEVYIHCYLVIVNNTENEHIIKLNADFSDDAKNKLLIESTLVGCDKNGNDHFEVKGGQKRELNIDFIGTYGGNPHKLDRNLPQIDIVMED